MGRNIHNNYNIKYISFILDICLKNKESTEEETTNSAWGSGERKVSQTIILAL